MFSFVKIPSRSPVYVILRDTCQMWGLPLLISPTVPGVATLEPASLDPVIGPWASRREGLVLKELG